MKRAPLIAISGGGRWGSASCLELAARLGAGRVLAKPFTIQQILGTIDEIIGS